MKKGIAILVVLLLLLGLLTACGSGKNGGEIKLIQVPLTEEQYAFGVDKNQPELLEQTN